MEESGNGHYMWRKAAIATMWREAAMTTMWRKAAIATMRREAAITYSDACNNSGPRTSTTPPELQRPHPRTSTTPPPNFNDPTPELQRPPRTIATPPELLQGPGNVKVELWRWRREGGRWRGRREEEGGGRRRRRRKEQKQTQDLHQGVRKTS